MASQATLATYIQNFEGLVQTSPTALSGDGWLVYGNVFDPTHTTYLYGYGPFPAPNGTGFWCDIDIGQGGAEQGAQQLSVYSDYNNADHAAGNLVESNVFRERTIDPTNVGRTWIFEFDAKLGNLSGASSAVAFIKTLNPSQGYALTNFLTVDMTTIPTTWSRYAIPIAIDPTLSGQILQFGFASTATHYENCGVFYDNIVFHDAMSTPVELPSDGTIGPARTRPTASVSPNPLNPAGVLAFRTSRQGPVTVRMFDLSGRLVRTLVESQILPAGSHEAPIDGHGAGGEILATGVYFYRVETADGAATGRFTIMK